MNIRKLRLESLEERTLLAVMAGGFEQTTELVAPTEATTWIVNVLEDPESWDMSDDVLSLREAISGAATGDVIVFDSTLTGGTIILNGNQLSVSKGITIDASAIGGITIDAKGKSRGVYIKGGDLYNRVELVDLTITGCSYGYSGGGVCNVGYLMMTDCTIIENYGYQGGGVFNAGTLTIKDSEILSNRSNSTNSYGAGLYNSKSAILEINNCLISRNRGVGMCNYGIVAITDSIISNNSDSYDVGGIDNDGTMTIRNSVISGNSTSSGVSGGISNVGILEISGCMISGNTSSTNGEAGGIFDNGTLIITNSVISGNSGDWHGGGIFIRYGTLTMKDCTIAGNSTKHCGGGIYNDSGTLTMINCAVMGNMANDDGGGVYNDSGVMTITNCTVSGNSASDDDGGIYSKGSLALTNTIVALNSADNGVNKDIYFGGYRLTGSNNIIGFDPGFVTAPVFDETGKLVNLDMLDLSLTETSWAIDRGDNIAVMTEIDITGNNRISAAWKSEATVDIGAYEYQKKTVINPSLVVTTIIDSLDDRDGFVSLREAVRDASDGDTIIFDETLSGRTITLNGRELYIDKSIAIDASAIGGITIDADGKSCAISCTRWSDLVELTGLTITGGNSNYGGGIYNGSSTLKMTACTVSGNFANKHGGGVYNDSGTMMIKNCTVVGNSATEYGGAVFKGAGTLTMTNCAVIGNTAGIDGGGVYSDSGVMRITNCTISGNSASDDGGGVYSKDSLTLMNTIISLNCADNSDSNNIYEGCNSFSGSNNVIGFNPGFVTAPVFDETGTLVNLDLLDLSLTETSWAIDRGDNGTVATLVDIAGNSRIFGAWESEATIDIGAYEYQERVDKEVETPSTIVTTAEDIISDIDGLISLREAIGYAKTNETVTFDSSLAGRTIKLNGLGLTIDKSIAIDASAIGGITIDADGKSRAISCTRCSDLVELTGLTITGGNSNYGGGIYNGSSVLKMTNCTTIGNSASNDGGGIYNHSGTLTMTNCAVIGNTANNNGGGVYNCNFYDSTSMMTSCTICKNIANDGGGIYNTFSYGGFSLDTFTMKLTYCSIAGNLAYNNGGGISVSWGSVGVTHCTISANSAISGGGAYREEGYITVTDTIIALNNNYDGSSSEKDLVGVSSGENNIIGSNPDFKIAPIFESGKLINYESLDFSLSAASYAIGSGTNGSDIGALAYTKTVTITDDGVPLTIVTTTEDKLDSSDGKISLREAILYAKNGDIITFDSTLAGQTIALRGQELVIDKDLTIDASEVGRIDIDANNKSRILYVNGASTELELVSIVLTNGQVTNGGAIFNNGILTLRNCIIWGNSAADSGGGIFNYSGSVSMINCTVAGNSAGYRNGGIYNTYYAILTLNNSIVAVNYADYDSDLDQYKDSFFIGSNNIIGLDPGFKVAPKFKEGKLSNIEEIDLSLTATSWAIDRGDNGTVATLVDIAGNSRIFGAWESEATVDIGAYEYQEEIEKEVEPPSTVVTTVSDTLNDADGLISLREAIYYANPYAIITFAPELSQKTITLAAAALVIEKNLSIDASAIGGITIDAENKSQIFNLNRKAKNENDWNCLYLELTALSIKNGRASVGGGIFSGYNSLTMTDCTVSANYANSGGGICSYGELTMTNTSISDNFADGLGGGIYNCGIITSTYCDFSGNSAGNKGGAIYNIYGTMTMSDCTVSRNTAGGYGGGIYNDNPDNLMFVNCLVSENYANYGGGIYNYILLRYYLGKSRIMTNCIISDNLAYYSGGGIYHLDQSSSQASSLVLTNCLIFGNSANGSSYGGGGICNIKGTLSVTNCTITGNTTNHLGGGICCVNSGSISFYNTIIVQNAASSSGNDIWNDVSCNCYAYNSLSSYTNWRYSFDCLTYDSSLPLFTDSPNGNFFLAKNSQAIDSGNNSYISKYETDLSGNSRRINNIVDIGAYEYQGDLPTFDISLTGWSGNYDSTSHSITVDDPYTDTDIILFSTDGKTYNLTQMPQYTDVGTYTTYVMVSRNGYWDWYGSATVEITPATINDVTLTSFSGSYDALAHSITVSDPHAATDTIFYSTDGVNYNLTTCPEYFDEGIYTTYVRVIRRCYTYWEGSAKVEIRHVSPIVTTLEDWVDSRDGKTSLREAIGLAIEGDVITFDTNLSGGTILLDGTQLEITKSISIDASSIGGVTINANEQSRVFYILISDGSDKDITLIGLTIKGGMNVDKGGGIYNQNSSLTLTNSIISGNTAESGGGIYNRQNSTLTLMDTTVSGNTANGYGGGIYNCSTLTLSNSTVSGNTANQNGGGIYSLLESTLTLTDSTVSENSSDYGGGIYGGNRLMLSITNCTVSGNTASYGGGIYVAGSTFQLQFLTNCTVSGNTANDYGGGIYIKYGTLTLYNTIIAQNAAGSSGNDVYRQSGFLYAYNTLSSFTDWTESEDCLLYDPEKPLFKDSANGDFALAENSQAIDKGNNEYVETDTDLAGNVRIANGIVDLGAYEYGSSSPTEQLALPTITTGNKSIYVSYGANRHQITWNAIENAVGYELSFSTNENSWTTIFTTETAAVVTGLTYGQDIKYRVRAMGTDSYTDSDWSEIKTFNVCPMDVNNDGDITGGDRGILAYCWLAEEGDDDYIPAADINGDGDVTGGDRAFLSQNWLGEAGDEDLIYPVAKAADAVFAEFKSADLGVDLDVF